MLDRVAIEKNILLAWIIGHRGIQVKEPADLLVKEAATNQSDRIGIVGTVSLWVHTHFTRGVTARGKCLGVDWRHMHILGYCSTDLGRFCDQRAETPKHISLKAKQSQEEGVWLSAS